MKKLLLFIFLILSITAIGQSSFYGNSYFNFKDPRNTNTYWIGYHNNGDSVATIGVNGIRAIKPITFTGWNTAGRPALAVAGMIGYNTDSTALEYYNGASWNKLSVSSGGGSVPTFQQVLTQGSTLTGANTITLGTNTLTFNSNSATKLHIDANGRVSVGGTNNAGNAFYSNGSFGGADGSVLFSFASASLQYYCPSSDMIIRLNGQGEEWRIAKFTSSFDIYPVTSNGDPLRFRDNANGDIFHILPSNKTIKIFSVPTSASPTSILFKQSDSSVSQLPFTGSTTNFLRADGTFAAPSTGLPSQTGNAGKVLTTDGTNASWAHPIFPWDYAIRDSASTSNAVATTAHSVTVDANSRGIIEVRVEAVSSDGTKGLTGIKRVRYKKIAGTLTLGTVETEMAIEYDGGLSTANFTITTSSNNPIIQVTGEAAQDLNWKVTVLITNKSVFP